MNGQCECRRQAGHAVGAQDKFHVVVLQIFRPVVTDHHVNGAVKHAVPQGRPVGHRAERSSDLQRALESSQVFVGVNQMTCGGAARHGKSFGFGFSDQVKRLGGGHDGKVQLSACVTEHLQITRHPKHLRFHRDAEQPHFGAHQTLVHHPAVVQVGFQGQIQHGLAVGPGVGQGALQGPHTVHRRIVREGHRAVVRHVAHFSQLLALASFRDAAHGQHFGRAA